MTRHDFNVLLAHGQYSDKKSALHEKWKDEEALEIAKRYVE